MTDNTQDNLSKEKGQKVFHKKLHRKLNIDLYKEKGSNIVLIYLGCGDWAFLEKIF
jgi:hypothetical protein